MSAADAVLTAAGQRPDAAQPRLEGGSKEGPTSLVYILGAGHSGSTLLAMLLAAHPRICTIGEVKAPALHDRHIYRCSCGQLLDRCGFWKALAEGVAARGVTLDIGSGTSDIRRAESPYVRRLLKPLHRGPVLEGLRELALSVSPAWRVHRRRFDALTASLARVVCTLTGCDVFVDSSKTGLQLKYLLRNPALDVKVIRLVRDGRGVAHSYCKSDGLSMARAAYIWRRSNEEAATVAAGLAPDRWFDLRYESLCRDAPGTLRRLCEFVGVDPVPAPSHAGREQHVLGNNNMRLNVAQIRLDEKWRQSLTEADLRTFDRVAGALNRRLGYS